MAYITLMDNDFHLFHNLPRHLSMSELNFDTPCAEAIFNAEHPYRDRNFRFQGDGTVLQALQNLLKKPKSTVELNLTSLDMLLFIGGEFPYRIRVPRNTNASSTAFSCHSVARTA